MLAGRGDAPRDAELLDRLVKSEGRADHADRADDRGLIADDLIGGAGNHVTARGRNILHERYKRDAFFRLELPYAL